jgi:hypothetical protein
MRNPARSFKMGLSRDYVGMVSNQVESVVCRRRRFTHLPLFIIPLFPYFVYRVFIPRRHFGCIVSNIECFLYAFLLF